MSCSYIRFETEFRVKINLLTAYRLLLTIEIYGTNDNPRRS